MVYRNLKAVIAFIVIGLIAFWIGIFIRLHKLAEMPSPQGPLLTAQFMDVGDGDSAMISSPGGLKMLIDAGPDDQDAQEIVQKLHGLPKNLPNFLVLTCARERSIGGVPYVLSHTAFCGTIVLPCSISRFTALGGDTAQEIIGMAAARKLKAESWSDFEAKHASVLEIDPNTSVSLLPIEPDFRRGQVDADSIAVRVDYGASSILYAAGLTPSEESTLVAQRARLGCDILAATGGGGEDSLSSEFLALSAPRVAVISTSPESPPDPDTLARLGAAGASIERTDMIGTVTLGMAQGIDSPIGFVNAHTNATQQ